jgi:putative membrane protein
MIGKFFARSISKFNYKISSLIIIAIISGLVAFFSGLLGLAVLLVSTLIGLLAPLSGVRRIHLMACLIVPVVLYFI